MKSTKLQTCREGGHTLHLKMLKHYYLVMVCSDGRDIPALVRLRKAKPVNLPPYLTVYCGFQLRFHDTIRVSGTFKGFLDLPKTKEKQPMIHSRKLRGKWHKFNMSTCETAWFRETRGLFFSS